MHSQYLTREEKARGGGGKGVCSVNSALAGFPWLNSARLVLLFRSTNRLTVEQKERETPHLRSDSRNAVFLVTLYPFFPLPSAGMEHVVI